MELVILWYLVVGLSATAYVVLDGFDLGVGMLHLFTKKDEERRLMLNAIGPVWDGNEVWIVIVAGTLLSGFPDAYATICSVFYTPIMIFLSGIIFRAVAIEFRSKLPQSRWRNTWDVAFSLGSYVITFILGVLLGNLVVGIALDSKEEFSGSFTSFFTPYPVLMGITAIAVLMMHGAIYLNMKIDGEFHAKTKRWSYRSMIFFVIMYVALTISTVIFEPHMIEKMKQYPFLFLVAALAGAIIYNVIRMLKKDNSGWAFICSSIALALLIGLFGVGTFPVLLRSTIDPAQYSITIFNAASSEKTLKILLTIAAVGVPLVLAYGYWIYRIFRGKVRLDSHSY